MAANSEDSSTRSFWFGGFRVLRSAPGGEVMSDDVTPALSMLVAAVSLSQWTIVALGGRWIGFP